MDLIICVTFLTILQSVRQCDGVSLQEQLEHIAARRRESQGIPVADFLPSRRYYDFHPARSSVVLGAPSMVSHLPEAEPILPGHTLIRPSLDMLKSSIKFPHKDMDNGAGVYGNIDNLSIRWDGRNERVMYTGFRRMNDRDGTMAGPELPRRNYEDDNDYSLLASLLRGDRDSNKHDETLKRPRNQNVLYSAIYPYKKGRKPKVINVQQPYIQSDQVLMDKIQKMASKNKNRMKPKLQIQYAYVNLDNIDRLLRSYPKYEKVRTENAIVSLHNSDENTSDNVDSHGESEEEKVQKAPDNNVQIDPKLIWFWNSKDAFNHIHISPEAPELFELIPVKNTDDSKQWSFYNEANFEPFEKRY